MLVFGLQSHRIWECMLSALACLGPIAVSRQI